MDKETIEKMLELLENVKSTNNSPVGILCYKEHEDIFREYFKGYKIWVLPDIPNRFDFDESDKDKVWIIPYKEENKI